MPKATKKQKEKVADFSKAKLKLGKGKQIANNATDTSYKARSIALPTQNPLLRSLRDQDPDLANSDAKPVSHRGLTLHEVLVLLRHTNKGARKEALDELKDVLVDGMQKGVAIGRREGEVGMVVRGILALITDEERTVRKALLGFVNWYLPVLPSDVIDPHLPILLLQTSSALSHIFPEVRIDACHLVSLLLDIAPDSVVSTWPYPKSALETTGQEKVEENTILSGLRLAAGLGGQAGEGGAMGQTLLPASKLVVLKTILAFVRAGLKKQGLVAVGTSAGSGSASGSVAAKDIPFPTEIFERFEVAYNRTRHPLGGQEDIGKEVDLSEIIPLEQLGEADGWLFGTGLTGLETTGWDIGRRTRGDDQDEYELGEVLSSLYLNLQPLLLSSLLESAPAAFSLSTGSSIDVHVSLCSTIIDLVVALAGAVLKDFPKTKSVGEVKKAVTIVVNKIGAYFPFGNLNEIRGQKGNAQLVETQQAISVAYSTLVVELQPTPGRLPSRPKTATAKQVAGMMEQGFLETLTGRTNKERAALAGVAGWLCDLLSTNGDALQPALSPHVYVTTLPVIWSLLTSFSFIPSPGEDESIPAMMLNALLEHLSRAGADSATKRLGNEFVCRLVVVHETKTPIYPFHIPAKSPCRQALARWLVALPRTLWELGNKDHETSRQILQFLLWLGNRSDTLFSSQDRATLRSTLAPYFWLEHPSKGPLAGPWAKLGDQSLRRLALDVAMVWSKLGDDLHTAVAKAASGVSQDAAYWQRTA